MHQVDEEREIVTPEQAAAMLPDGDTVHVFRNPMGNTLVGADWTKAELLKAFQKYGVELSGPAATAMHHGICFMDESGWVFVSTKE